MSDTTARMRMLMLRCEAAKAVMEAATTPAARAEISKTQANAIVALLGEGGSASEEARNMFLRLAASVGFEAADLVRVVAATEKIVGAKKNAERRRHSTQ